MMEITYDALRDAALDTDGAIHDSSGSFPNTSTGRERYGELMRRGVAERLRCEPREVVTWMDDDVRSAHVCMRVRGAWVGFPVGAGRGHRRETPNERGTLVHESIAKELAEYRSPPDGMPEGIDWKCGPYALRDKRDAWASALAGYGPLPHEATGEDLDALAAVCGVERKPGYIPFLDKLDREAMKVEGVSLAELVITLCDAQREIPHQMKKWASFTPAQKDAARAEWSRQVKRDVRMHEEEEREREKQSLSVDDDRWDV